MSNNLKLTSKLVHGNGTTHAFHVFGPILAYKKSIAARDAGVQTVIDPRVANLPVMAVKWSGDSYKNMLLVHRVDILGPSVFEDVTDRPLPGTRGVVAIFTTTADIVIHYPVCCYPQPVHVVDRVPDELIAEILRKYL